MSDSLERARGHRASLRSALGSVESALAAPTPGREEPWRQELGTKLRTLQDAVESHIEATEGEDGLLAEIMLAAPRLAPRVSRAKAAHERLRTDVGRALAAVEEQGDVAAIREDVVALLTDLVRHRQLGADLIYEAYSVDIEAAD